MPKDQQYTIKVVARRTGLSPHVIRIWERRYKAVSPARTATDRRLYSDADIERLQLLRAATLCGHSIGRIADLPLERLKELAAADQAASLRPAPGGEDASGEVPARSYLQSCLSALESMDAEALEAVLARAAVALGQPAMMANLLIPLMQHVGEGWRQGSLRVAHEHLASAIIRSFLGNLTRGPQANSAAPNLVITTPSGQLHELGALMAAATAASEGWRVTYLGPNLPVEEIAAAVLRSNARAVALSIVYPADDPRVEDELRKLGHYLPRDVTVLAGGRAVDDYAAVLDDIGAIRVHDMLSLRAQLESLRSRATSAQSPA